MGDTSETNTKVLSRELVLGVVALKMPIQKNHYLRDKGPFPRYSHNYIKTLRPIAFTPLVLCVWVNKSC